MKVLVIGGAGYIGSHVVKELMKNGHKVTVFDNLSSGLRQNLFAENEFIYGNILLENDLDAAFGRGFDAFIHLAAFKAAGESMVLPEKYSVNNLTGTINIMNAAMKHNCKYMVFSSSAAVFGEPQYLPIDENHPKAPENYYGFTKLKIEEIMAWYDKLKGLKFAALRYFNAAGDDPEGEIGEMHDPETHIIPLVLDAAIGKRECIRVFGTDYPTADGSCIRDYIHVLDLADAHIRALDYMKREQMSNRLNLGTSHGTSVLQIIETAKKVTGRDIKVVYDERRAGDPVELIGSNVKAREVLGWVPQYSDIETILRDAWNWHRR